MKILVPTLQTLDSSNVPVSAFANYSATTTYAVGEKVFIPDAGYWSEYKCLVAGTIGVDPRTSVYNATSNPDGKWEFLGTTNRFKMFDQFSNTQTINPEKIETGVTAIDADGIYLGNLDAVKVTIKVIDNLDTSIIEEITYELYPDILDWMDYFYGKWFDQRKTQIAYERLTLTRDVSFSVIIDNGSGDAKCGIFLPGSLEEFGYAKLKVKLGIEDYSPIVKDTSTGATYIQKGNFAKVMGFDIFTPTETIERVYTMLTRLSGIPVVTTQNNFGLFMIYGYFQSSETICEDEQETAITGTFMGLI